MDEEVVLLEEQLAAAQTDIERLQSQLADAEARDAERAAELSAIKRQVAERDESLAAQSGELDALRDAVEQSRSEALEALSRYRQMVLERETDLPADLVTGDTVAEIETSLAEARKTVARVRRHLEQSAEASRIPAGSPPRGVPDPSDMTAAEKIRHGLNRT